MQKILGLDLGITSVGYAVVNLNDDKDNISGLIEKAGVRTFDIAENQKDGAPLGEPRRVARMARRMIRRKAKRMAQIKDLFVRENLIKPQEIEEICFSSLLNPWQIRAKALNEKLTVQEMYKALLHIAKRRGFKSMRKSAEERDKETGALLKGIKKIEEQLNATNFETIGQMFAALPLDKPKRNKDGSYENSVARAMLEKEVSIIFAKQQEFKNPIFSDEFKNKFTEIAFSQLPIQSFDGAQGNCVFEKDEKRAPKNSYTAEYFNALCKINNIRILKGAKVFALDAKQRQTALNLCLEKQKNNYKQLRQAFKMDDGDSFNISYLKPKAKDGVIKGDNDPETKTKIFEMKGYHEIRKALKYKPNLWENIKDNRDGTLDRIAEGLCFYKSDDEIKTYLKKYNISQDIIDVVCGLSFSGFMHLSSKAMRNLIPHLEKGLKYNEACSAVGYDFQAKGDVNRKSKIRPLNEQEKFSISSPVAKRSIAQTIKVINALNRVYGPFDAVHVELAREMGKNKKLRKEIEDLQKQNEDERNFIKNGGIEGILPQTALDIKKLRLWKQQGGYCMYSGKYIAPEDIFMEGYTQTDHIIPYSISFDNSMNNLVLCLTEENQNKKAKLPYEYFKEKARNWEEFKDKVQNSTLPNTKKLKLLKEEFTEDDLKQFKERNLSDTKFITSFIKNYLTQTLKLTDKYKDGVFGRNGRLTADLRGWWGLSKNREESDKHHATDAIVVACCTNGMMNYLSRMYKLNREESIKKIKHFMPLPWPNFRTDVLKTLNDIFVSRPPRKKVTGALHQDTYYSAKNLDKGFIVVRKNINKLKLSDIEKQRDLEEKYFGVQRNRKIYDAVAAALKERKSDKDGLNVIVDGRPIRKLKMISEACGGVKVLKGTAIAANAAMPRVDVFVKDGQYYLVPVYTIDFATGKMPLMSKPDNVEMDIKDFVFSIFKDDYLEIVQNTGEVFEGYFKHYTGIQIILESQDRSSIFMISGQKGKEARFEAKKAIRYSTLADIKKYQIDIFGHKYLIEKEKYVGNIKKRKCFGGSLKQNK